MKFLQKYKIFESKFISTVSTDDLKENLEDMEVSLKDNGTNISFNLEDTNDKILSILDINSYGNHNLISILDFYSIILLNRNISYSNFVFIDNEFDRLCKYLSSRYNKEIIWDRIAHTFNYYIIGSVETINFLKFIEKNELRSEEFSFEYLMDGLDTNNFLYQKYKNLLNYGIKFHEIRNNDGFSIILDRKGSNHDITMLVFDFNRKISDDITIINYDVLIRSKTGNQTQRAKKEEALSISFDVVGNNDEKLAKLIIDNANKYLKINKLDLTYKVLDVLNDTNEFFQTIDVELDNCNVEFLVKRGSDFIRFRVIIDDDLNITFRQFRNSLSFHVKPIIYVPTSVDELAHDIYLSLTQKD